MSRLSRCLTILAALCCASPLSAQAVKEQRPTQRQLLEIVRAEDERRFDGSLISLLADPDPQTRSRAALAAGRIGDESALPVLSEILSKDLPLVSEMAAFAIGEIESVKGAKSILSALRDKVGSAALRARSAEAAGKIAAANPDTELAKTLGEAVLDVLESEFRRGKNQDRKVIHLAITAVIRSKPEDGDYVVSKFITNTDPGIRADAANALARLASSRFNEKLRAMLLTEDAPVGRANAARALGAANDKHAVNPLLEAAFTDEDQRVRFSALGALGRISEKGSGSRVLTRAEEFLGKFRPKNKSGELNELLLLSSALGRIMKGTDDARTVRFLKKLGKLLGNRAPEVETALVRVSPRAYKHVKLAEATDWRAAGAIAAAYGTAAELPKSEDSDKLRASAESALRNHLESVIKGKRLADMSYPAVLNGFARYKTDDLAKVLRESLKLEDVVIREAAASLLGEQGLPENTENAFENYLALKSAYEDSEDDKMNDASLASLEAIKKQYLKLKQDGRFKIDSPDPITKAMRSPDYLVRKRAGSIAREIGLLAEPAPAVVKFDGKGITRLKRANYGSALKRKIAKAVLTTNKGKFAIDLFPHDAPLTVENFVNLAKAGYYDGLEIHRVVPNFVVQDGDPRGDGSGGPGWSIRCEINQIPYKRGTVGMALSGKDTGGSQWFVAHSPQPHLDGGYTVFGIVNEKGMVVVDKLVRGDIIKSVQIIE